jgi:phosphoribosylaminoimidazolecarboxamide formyltransferase/IMP cyclohydrolase
MVKLELKYGCNPNQKPASISLRSGGDLPVKVLNGKPGYINFMDALNSWQLVSQLKAVCHRPAAASFKHVSPAGAALGRPLTDLERQLYFTEPGAEYSDLAAAYIRARGTDRLSSYGDWAALSDVCDESVARYLKAEVSDGIIAPGYTPEALRILSTKKGGRYNVVEIDPDYTPDPVELRDIYGITFEQGRNDYLPHPEDFTNIVTKAKNLPPEAAVDMAVSLLTLKYTQSNSVCYVKDGQAIGVGAGQQSRIHCTRLAGSKADKWYLRSHPKVLALPFVEEIRRPDRDNAIDVYLSDECEDILRDGVWQQFFTSRPDPLPLEERKSFLAGLSGVTVGSDAFFPFGDNVERARKSGAAYIVQPGGSIRDDNVIETCDRYGIVMVFTGMRLFHH